MCITYKQTSYNQFPFHRPVYVGIVSLMLYAAFCTCLPGTITPLPDFTNLTPLSGNRYVAYTSPDPVKKPDTIMFACDHPGIEFSSIEIIAELDSGTTEIPLTNLISMDGGRAVLHWVPGADTVHFGYFGIKTCRLQLSDAKSGINAGSDSFTIFGSYPLNVESPVAGARYSLNDTIAVNYQINSDRISNIRVFFKNDSMTNWMEITGTTRRTAENAPLRAFSTLFIPDIWIALAPIRPGLPLRFLCKDYNSPLPNSSSISGDVFVE